MQIQRKIKQDKKIRNVTNTSKGITLIALVITIIVLLILAAVSIATLTGENGILTQASRSKVATEKGEAEDRIKLIINEWQIEKNKTNGQGLEEFLKSKVTNKELDKVTKNADGSFTVEVNGYQATINADGELTGEITKIGETPTPPADTVTPGVIVTGENKTYTKNGTAKIPEGFAIVPGLDDVSQGLVISDVANDTTNVGNQFVWIPVTNIDNFHTIEGYESERLQSYLSDSSEPYTNGYATEVSEYNSMKESVDRNHGFYIGRFEAGKVDNKVVVKKNVPVYNRIKWGTSMADTTGGAVELSKNFATEEKYTSVISTLCYGVQWDAALQFIDSNYITGTCESNSYLVNSTNKGNYSGSPINTGSNDNYAVKNIYDMAGNVVEWTMEAYGTLTRVSRGGDYDVAASKNPASRRVGYDPSRANGYIGFRVALYL